MTPKSVCIFVFFFLVFYVSCKLPLYIRNYCFIFFTHPKITCDERRTTENVCSTLWLMCYLFQLIPVNAAVVEAAVEEVAAVEGAGVAEVAEAVEAEAVHQAGLYFVTSLDL